MRALVLSGGASRGAFQVGACSYLAEMEEQYDLFCGISVGAINAAHLAQFGNFRMAIPELLKLWENLTTERVHKRWWPLGLAHGLWKLSLRDGSPLEAIVESCFSRQEVIDAGNKLLVGAVSLKTNEYRIWTEQDQDVSKAILASAAFPGILNPQFIDGQWWNDGGARNVTPLKGAIDAGATAIDVVMAEAALPVNRPAPRNVIDVLVGTLDAMTEEILVNDIKMARLYNQLPGKRHVEIRIVKPADDLPGEPLEFDPGSIKAMIAIGYDAARRQLG